MVAYSNPRNLKDKLGPRLVRKMMLKKDMKKCEKPPCQICGFVHEGCKFQGECTYSINFPFNCDSSRVRYVIRFMSEVLLRLSVNVSITITVILPGMGNDRGVWRVINYKQIFLSRVRMELMICVSK